MKAWFREKGDPVNVVHIDVALRLMKCCIRNSARSGSGYGGLDLETRDDADTVMQSARART